MELQINNLCKSFGPKQVLSDVSFTAAQGLAMGLLGRNGAGKTTTIRIIMHVFPPDSGKVLLDGRPLHPDKVAIGYLPEEKGLYPKYKIGDQLLYLGQLRGLSRRKAADATARWLKRLSLEEYFDKKLETLSKGNQQKIQLALALLADPQIVILDEPFSGLDPVNAQLLKDIVREQVDLGKIVLFSSHQMSYVEQFCDRIAILDKGSIVLQGELRNLKRQHAGGRLLITLAAAELEQQQKLRQVIEGSRLAARISLEEAADGLLLHLSRPDDRQDIFTLLADSRLPVEQFRIVEPTLEELFIEKVGERDEEAAV